MLISYLEVGNKFIEKNKEEAKKYFKAIYDHNQNPEEVKETIKSELDSFLDINYYQSQLSSMVYVKTVDNLITYFKEILSEIVISKPQVLKSQETEKLDFILDYDSMNDLVNAIANKKIEELFYKGIDDIEKFFKSRLGVDIFKSDTEKENINLLIKQRNLTVHNRGKISKEFSKQYSKQNPDIENRVGEYFIFQFEYVSSINLYVFNFVAEIDEELSKKFKLKK